METVVIISWIAIGVSSISTIMCLVDFYKNGISRNINERSKQEYYVVFEDGSKELKSSTSEHIWYYDSSEYYQSGAFIRSTIIFVAGLVALGMATYSLGYFKL